MVDVIQDFFDSGTMPRGLNNTFIALIPKGEGSSRLSQFRPISLCNVVYKAIMTSLFQRCFKNSKKTVDPRRIGSVEDYRDGNTFLYPLLENRHSLSKF